MALNKIDILENDAALAKVIEFVARNMDQVLGAAPKLFPVSARLAQWATAERDADKRAFLSRSSRVDALAGYIRSELDDRARIQLKLANPMGVAERVVAQVEEAVHKQADALQVDRENGLSSSIA